MAKDRIAELLDVIMGVVAENSSEIAQLRTQVTDLSAKIGNLEGGREASRWSVSTGIAAASVLVAIVAAVVAVVALIK